MPIAKQNHAAYALVVQNKAANAPRRTAPASPRLRPAPLGRGSGQLSAAARSAGCEFAWPITGATFILLYKEQANPAATGEAVLKFFDWAYKNGDAAASSLDYVPLPAPVKALVRKQWATTRSRRAASRSTGVAGRRLRGRRPGSFTDGPAMRATVRAPPMRCFRHLPLLTKAMMTG